MVGEDLSCEDEERPFETRRLRLRRARLSDAADVALHANDRQIAEMTSRIPFPYGEKDALAFLGHPETDELTLAVTRSSDGSFLGLCSLQAREQAGRVELGYWIGRPFWGQGFATEAAQAMIDHAFGALGVEVVEVRCRVINGASRRVIHKCGFHYQGTGLALSLAAGRVASETYSMDRRCWESLKAWGRAS